MRPTPREDLHAPSVLATALVLWRLGIAAVALVGFCLAMLNGTRQWTWLGLYQWSQLSTLFAFLVALGGVAAPAFCPNEATMNVLRGAASAYVAITMVGYRFLIGGDYSLPSSLLEHLVVPLLVLADWLLVCRGQARVRWWWPFVWFVGPMAYVALYIHGSLKYGVTLYPILEVGSDTFWRNLAWLFASFAPLFYLIWGAPRAVRLARAGDGQPQRV